MNRLRSLATVLAGGLLLTGCEFSVYQMPLPGGADVGDDPIVVHAEFTDVLDLVPQSTVKYNDVTVGKVTKVELDDYTADVELTIRRDVEIPANAITEIRQTSLLGEKFVSFATPTAPQGRLEDGDRLTLDQTGRNPEVEEVLGALSLLLNGGGVAQLKTISHELSVALEGRESAARSVLEQIEQFSAQLDDHKGDIVHAIDALNRLAVTANEHKADLESALDELPEALQSLDRQRADLVRMLQSLGRLGDVGTRVILASKTATIDTLRQLNPVLTELGKAGDDLANAFHVFLTYPFVDEVVGRNPQVARNLHMGDYTNLSVQLDINLPGGGGGPGGTLPTIIDPTAVLNDIQKCLEGDQAACLRVLSKPAQLLQLKEECEKPENKDAAICEQLNSLPLGTGTSLDPGVLGDLGLGGIELPGLGRAPVGSTTSTLDRLMGWYNPVLVQALLPGVAQ